MTLREKLLSLMDRLSYEDWKDYEGKGPDNEDLGRYAYPFARQIVDFVPELLGTLDKITKLSPFRSDAVIYTEDLELGMKMGLEMAARAASETLNKEVD